MSTKAEAGRDVPSDEDDEEFFDVQEPDADVGVGVGVDQDQDRQDLLTNSPVSLVGGVLPPVPLRLARAPVPPPNHRQTMLQFLHSDSQCALGPSTRQSTMREFLEDEEDAGDIETFFEALRATSPDSDEDDGDANDDGGGDANGSPAPAPQPESALKPPGKFLLSDVIAQRRQAASHVPPLDDTDDDLDSMASELTHASDLARASASVDTVSLTARNAASRLSRVASLVSTATGADEHGPLWASASWLRAARRYKPVSVRPPPVLSLIVSCVLH